MSLQSGSELASDMRALDPDSLRRLAAYIREVRARGSHAALTRILHREQLAMIDLLLADPNADTSGPEERWDKALADASGPAPDIVVAELAAALELDDEERVAGGQNPLEGGAP